MSVLRSKDVNINGINWRAKAEIYDNTNEVVRDCQTRPVRLNKYRLESVSPDFHGVRSYEEALEFLRNGYQPVVERLRSSLKVMPTEYKSIVSVVNSHQGFVPSVPLALKNLPNSMLDMQYNFPKHKVLDVYYDMTASCSTEPEQFIKAGKVLLETIMLLERSGYKFNLYGVQTYCQKGNCTGDLDFFCVKIKSSDKPFDLKRMSYPLTHPSFFRVIGFDWQGKSPITRDVGSMRGMGLYYLFHNLSEPTRIAQAMFGDNAFYISCAQIIKAEWTTDEVKAVFSNVGTKTKAS